MYNQKNNDRKESKKEKKQQKNKKENSKNNLIPKSDTINPQSSIWIKKR